MIANQPECVECEGACCQPDRLEFPRPEWAPEQTGYEVLEWLGLGESIPLGMRVNEHGRTVVRVECHRRGRCDEATRPEPCLSFPLHYFDDDHTDAERDEVRGFCPLFRRLELERA